MKVAVIIGVALLGLLGLVLAFSEPSNSTTMQNNESNEVSLSTFEKDVESGTPLIDVRTSEEFEAGHIQNSVNLPLDKIMAGTVPATEKDKKIYLYCRSGNRSAEAKKVLEQAGYTNIVDLGGINEVVALGAKQVK